MLAIELISSGLSLQRLGVRLGFPTRDWAGSLQWKHKILGTSPVVSGKGPGLWLCRKEFLQRQKVVKQVFIEGKEYNTCGETPGQTLRESLWVTPAWQFKSLTWGASSGFHLASHFALPGSQPMFGISQDPLTCALASVGQGGFYHKIFWAEYPLTLLPLWPPKSLLCACVVREAPWLRECEICGLSRP